ncbi:MAG: CopG family transcriptional regulator [Terriglobales bacterium]
MLKVTFTLDDATIARLERTARRLGVPKSAVVREAVLEYAARAGQLAGSEQARLLAAVDRIAHRPPTREQAQLDEELASLRAARRGAGASGGEG